MRKRSGRSTTTFDYYLRFDEITDFLHHYASSHPHLMTVESAGKSYEGRDLWLVKVSNSGFDGTKPVVFIDSNIHGREWIAVMTMLNFLHQIIEHSEEFPELFAVDWMIVPLVNPDGYEFSHTQDRFFRKTRKPNPNSNCIGVDPNRNFPYKWEVGTFTSNSPCSEIFRGPSAESEVEVQIITKLMRENASLIKLHLALHSYGNLLIYPFGYEYNVPNPYEAELNTLGTRVANAIKAQFPTAIYTPGTQPEVIYPASGVSTDFSAGELGIPFAFTIELPGGGTGGFDLEPERIQQASDEIFVGYREFALWLAEVTVQ